jgi:hypothetical protein
MALMIGVILLGLAVALILRWSSAVVADPSGDNKHVGQHQSAERAAKEIVEARGRSDRKAMLGSLKLPDPIGIRVRALTAVVRGRASRADPADWVAPHSARSLPCGHLPFTYET